VNRARRCRPDDGASLIIVLIIVTVVAAVLGVVLSQADTSIRTTVALSDEANSYYGIDGAAQVAVSQLQKSGFPGGNCGSATDESTPFNGWVAGSGSDAGGSVRVHCDRSDNGAVDPDTPNTSPGSAILTLATVASGEDGIYVNSTAPGSNNPVKVRGGIFSNSTINVAAGQLQNSWTPPASNPNAKTYVVARGACTGTIQYNSAYGTKTCNLGSASDPRGLDPGTLAQHGGSYDPPTASTSNATISTCGSGDKYQYVTPGRLTSAAALNGMTGCGKGIVWFKPGVYYFDFQDAGESNRVWNIDDTFVVAGTPASNNVLTANPSAASWPDACVPPTPSGTTTGTGAEFVFGSNSRVSITHQGNPGGQLTICGSNTSAATGGGPPIAVYGLKTSVGPVAAQGGCVTSVSGRCALIYTDQSPNTSLTIQGTTYTPRSWLNLSLNNSTNQVFRWGLITRSISINTTGSPDLSNAVIDVPDAALIPIPTPKNYYLSVYYCAGQATCASGGTLALRVTVQVSVTTPATATVLSWSEQN
jgi:hypothetical protein